MFCRLYDTNFDGDIRQLRILQPLFKHLNAVVKLSWFEVKQQLPWSQEELQEVTTGLKRHYTSKYPTHEWNVMCSKTQGPALEKELNAARKESLAIKKTQKAAAAAGDDEQQKLRTGKKRAIDVVKCLRGHVSVPCALSRRPKLQCATIFDVHSLPEFDEKSSLKREAKLIRVAVRA